MKDKPSMLVIDNEGDIRKKRDLCDKDGIFYILKSWNDKT